jgi:hypothetical protein
MSARVGLISARARVVVATTLVAAVVAACGSSSSSQSGTVSAQTYVKSLCSAVIPFERAVVSHSALLNQASPQNPQQSKKAVQAFFTAVASDTGKAAQQIRKAGTPNVKNGRRISGAITQAFTRVSGAMSRAAAQSASLPTTSPKAFNNAVTTLSHGFTTSMSDIVQSLRLGALRSPELQKASTKTPACKTLTASS